MMKGLLVSRYLLTSLLFALVFVACGDDDTSTADMNNDAPSQPPSDTMSAVGDTVELDHGITVTLHEIRAPIENPRYATDDETDVLGLDVELCAGSDLPDGSLTAEPFAFSSRMPDNTRHNVSLGEFDPQFIRSDLAPGECNRGWVTFVHDADVRPSQFMYEMTYGETTAHVRWPFAP